jgi:hypothetical protein
MLVLIGCQEDIDWIAQKMARGRHSAVATPAFWKQHGWPADPFAGAIQRQQGAYVTFYPCHSEAVLSGLSRLKRHLPAQLAPLRSHGWWHRCQSR